MPAPTASRTPCRAGLPAEAANNSLGASITIATSGAIHSIDSAAIPRTAFFCTAHFSCRANCISSNIPTTRQGGR